MGQVQGKSGCPATIQVQALLEGPANGGQVGASCYGIGAGTPGKICTMGLVQDKSGRPAMVLVQALLTGPAPWVWCRASRGVLLQYRCRHSWKGLQYGSGVGQVGASCYGTGAGTPGRTCTMGLAQGKSERPDTIQVQALLTGPSPCVWRRVSRSVLIQFRCRHS